MGQTFSMRMFDGARSLMSNEPYAPVLVILHLNAQCHFHAHFRHTLGQASSAART
jgi:hypothetical protein